MSDQYHIRCIDESGQDFDQDLIVRATSYEEAVEIWVRYYEEPDGFSSKCRVSMIPVRDTVGAYSWNDITATAVNFRFDDDNDVWVPA